MLKKIALVMLLALPMGVFAQNLKFGHINAQEIITVMPEFTKAQNDIQNLEKQLTAELQRTQEEFNKKYQEFQQAIAKDSLPPNIAERRQKELQDMNSNKMLNSKWRKHKMMPWLLSIRSWTMLSKP